MTRTVRLDRIVDDVTARVVLSRGQAGDLIRARFALDGLPRVEEFLVGRAVAEVPTLVERLCGLCPVVHHLAGARALDALAGAAGTTPTAETVRRLLLHGTVLEAHARRLVEVSQTPAHALRLFARQVVVAAAGARHVPRCAVPGGVRSAVSADDRDALAGRAGTAIQRAADLLAQVETREGRASGPVFAGHDVALVDRTGALDLYGAVLRARAADDELSVEAASPAEWAGLVAESRPGAAASRPFLRRLGPDRGGYRVGPVAQLRVATHLSTPAAESARQRWAVARGGARWARAVVALHAAEVVHGLLGDPDLVAGTLVAPETGPPGGSGQPRSVTGWVEGPRGLLVHCYRVDAGGVLSDATITTPTAQNERWLAQLLTGAARERPTAITSLGAPAPGLAEALEDAVREADPCLPCSSRPTGMMGLRILVGDVPTDPAGSGEG
ncbi:MAG: nickel-dependent hydrogenase large subunit [Nocardioidaceae bacterium]